LASSITPVVAPTLICSFITSPQAGAPTSAGADRWRRPCRSEPTLRGFS
jgi:hypothetical protein